MGRLFWHVQWLARRESGQGDRLAALCRAGRKRERRCGGEPRIRAWVRSPEEAESVQIKHGPERDS